MSILVNKVVWVNGRRTSMRMSNKEWEAFEEICTTEKVSRNDLLSMIEAKKNNNLGLTYSTRLFIICYFRTVATIGVHKESAHGTSHKLLNLKKIIEDALGD